MPMARRCSIRTCGSGRIICCSTAAPTSATATPAAASFGSSVTPTPFTSLRGARRLMPSYSWKFTAKGRPGNTSARTSTARRRPIGRTFRPARERSSPLGQRRWFVVQRAMAGGPPHDGIDRVVNELHRSVAHHHVKSGLVSAAETEGGIGRYVGFAVLQGRAEGSAADVVVVAGEHVLVVAAVRACLVEIGTKEFFAD